MISEEGLEGHEFGELSNSLAASGPWKSGVPPGTQVLKPMIEDFNNDFFSLVRNIDDGDEVALAATDTQGESEFCMPSGPVD